MNDIARLIKGVKPGFSTKRGKRTQVYMLVDLAERSKGNVSIEQLAAQFVLPPKRVLEVLTAGSPGQVATTNRWALEQLYQQEGRIFDEELGLTTVPSALANPPKHSQATKRSIVRDSAYASTKITPDGKRTPVYYEWSLPSTDVIALPLSTGFRDTLERYKEYKETKPDLDAFAKLVAQLIRDLERLQDALVELAAATRGAMPEFAALTGLHAVADIECEMQSRPAPGESPMADLENFLVDSAIPLFKQHLIDEPRGTTGDVLGLRDAMAKRILDSWQDEAWKSGIQLVMDHHEVVDHQLWEDTYYALEKAVALLPLTRLRDRYCEEQVEPFIYHIAKEELDPEFEKLLRKELSAEDAADYIEGWKTSKVLGASVLSIASSVSVATIAIGANLPGPMSLWLAVTHVSLYHAIAVQARDGVKMTRINKTAIAIINRIAKWANLSIRETSHLKSTVAEAYKFSNAPPRVRYAKTIEALKIDWDGRLMRGAGIRGGTAVVASAVLMMTLVADPLESYQNFVGFMSAAFGAGLAYSDLGPISDFLTKHGGKVVKGGIRSVATLISVFGVVSGALTMKDGFARGDHYQVIEGALGGAGSFVSLGAWFVASMGYVPIPQYVMAIGTLLVLASIGLSVWRNIYNSVEEFVFGILEALEKEDSFTQRAGLGPTVVLIRELVEGTAWDQIPQVFRQDLEARGFPLELAEELAS